MRTIVRGRYVVAGDASPNRVRIVQDGAVVIDDGKVTAIENFRDINVDAQNDRLLGSERHAVIPGLVNSHHHVGLTPFQLGAPDLPMELWTAARLACRNVDPYLDTLYSAIQMVESGITTVQHVHSQPSGSRDNWLHRADEVLRAYRDIGMRVAYCVSLRDRNRFVYASEEEFLGRLPSDLREQAEPLLRAQVLPARDQFDLFAELFARYDRHRDPRVRVHLNPSGPHWCSDALLAAAHEQAANLGTRLHTNLLETRYQKEFAHRAYGVSAVQHLRDIGYLGPELSLPHSVWVTDYDIELLAESGATVVHNASSNLRLRSGIAPVNDMLARGVRVAIGIDEAGINDDRDMLQEMRVALSLHQPPDNQDSISASAILRMATENGAGSTGFNDHVGMLEVGKAADMTLIDWDAIANPYLDESVPIVDAIIRRAPAHAVTCVLVDGEPILRDGQLTRVNKGDLMRELAERLRVPLRGEELERAQVASKLRPHMVDFYRNWLERQELSPFYRFNSTD